LLVLYLGGGKCSIPGTNSHEPLREKRVTGKGIGDSPSAGGFQSKQRIKAPKVSTNKSPKISPYRKCQGKGAKRAGKRSPWLKRMFEISKESRKQRVREKGTRKKPPKGWEQKREGRKMPNVGDSL